MKIDSPQILTPTITGSLLISGSLVVSEGLTSSYAKLTNIPTKTSNTQFLTLDGSGNVGKKTIGGTMYTGSTYPITASWAIYALNGGTTLNTGSTYPITCCE